MIYYHLQDCSSSETDMSTDHFKVEKSSLQCWIMMQASKTHCFAEALPYFFQWLALFINVVAGHLLSINEIRYMILSG